MIVDRDRINREVTECVGKRATIAARLKLRAANGRLISATIRYAHSPTRALTCGTCYRRAPQANETEMEMHTSRSLYGTHGIIVRPTPHARSRWIRSLFAICSQVRLALQRAREIRRTAAELENLSDYQLHDIDIRRSDIEHCARQGPCPFRRPSPRIEESLEARPELPPQTPTAAFAIRASFSTRSRGTAPEDRVRTSKHPSP
jgi:uncharacterized protein YjiS (DUF1127 family)